MHVKDFIYLFIYLCVWDRDRPICICQSIEGMILVSSTDSNCVYTNIGVQLNFIVQLNYRKNL
jgi:hypothetical protein